MMNCFLYYVSNCVKKMINKKIKNKKHILEFKKNHLKMIIEKENTIIIYLFLI